MTDTMNFSPEYDVPLDYMRRTREYYLALGYDNPYRWAHYVDAPYQPLKKPLKDSTLALHPWLESSGTAIWDGLPQDSPPSVDTYRVRYPRQGNLAPRVVSSRVSGSGWA